MNCVNDKSLLPSLIGTLTFLFNVEDFLHYPIMIYEAISVIHDHYLKNIYGSLSAKYFWSLIPLDKFWKKKPQLFRQLYPVDRHLLGHNVAINICNDSSWHAMESSCHFPNYHGHVIELCSVSLSYRTLQSSGPCFIETLASLMLHRK